MARGLRAPLSPNEELTLRRVALGIALAKDLPVADVLRLRNLALIEDRGERLGLTALGKERYQRFREDERRRGRQRDRWRGQARRRRANVRQGDTEVACWRWPASCSAL